MGYSISWLAFDEKDPARVFAALGLAHTGVMEEFPESPTTGALLPSGWYVLVVQTAEAPLIDPELASALAHDVSVVTGTVTEDMMRSEACGYAQGRQTWRVMHNGKIELDHLEVEGALPAEFDAIAAKFRAAQAAEGESPRVDLFFEIPVVLVETLTSFRYDVDTPVQFEMLESAPDDEKTLDIVIEDVSGKPWWRFW
jgi:hypothetical protein